LSSLRLIAAALSARFTIIRNHDGYQKSRHFPGVFLADREIDIPPGTLSSSLLSFTLSPLLKKS